MAVNKFRGLLVYNAFCGHVTQMWALISETEFGKKGVSRQPTHFPIKKIKKEFKIFNFE